MSNKGKQQIFYIHGGESFTDYDTFIDQLKTKEIWDLPSVESKGKWTNVLPEELGDDFEVFMPAMPNKQNAKYKEWKIWFERHFDHLNDGLILMGCSLGAMFLYKYLIDNNPPVKIKALILMASPAKIEDEYNFADEGCGDFAFELNDVSKISEKADKVIIMHSKDDFLVPYEHGIRLHKIMPDSEMISFEDKNHFLVEKFPELVAKIKEIAGE